MAKWKTLRCLRCTDPFTVPRRGGGNWAYCPSCRKVVSEELRVKTREFRRKPPSDYVTLGPWEDWLDVEEEVTP